MLSNHPKTYKSTKVSKLQSLTSIIVHFRNCSFQINATNTDDSLSSPYANRKWEILSGSVSRPSLFLNTAINLYLAIYQHRLELKSLFTSLARKEVIICF